MSSREIPFAADDLGAAGHPGSAGPGWAQRERLGGQLRSVRRWIIFAGVATTAAFAWLAVHQTTTSAAGQPTGSQSGQPQTNLPANAPSQSLFTSGTTSDGSGGSGFSLAPASSSGRSFFRTASS